MIIRDPSSGQAQMVTAGGMAMTKSVCQTINEYANRNMENGYSAVIAATPTGAGDCFFYMTNNDDKPILISSLKLYAASTESVQVKLGDTGVVGGTHAALVPANRNAGSAKEADVTCESGVDITGLSGGRVVDELVGGTTMVRWLWLTGMVIPKNRTLSLYAVTGAIAIKATLGFCFLCDSLEP